MAEYQTAYADVNLLYGGLFIRDEGHWADVIEVIDLDSAAGTRNMTLVGQGSVSIEYVTAGHYGTTTKLGAQRETLRSCMIGAGPGWHEDFRITGLDRDTARMIAYAALWSFGLRDLEESTVLANDTDWSAEAESWEPEDTVDGEDGLRDWLSHRYGVETRS